MLRIAVPHSSPDVGRGLTRRAVSVPVIRSNATAASDQRALSLSIKSVSAIQGGTEHPLGMYSLGRTVDLWPREGTDK